MVTVKVLPTISPVAFNIAEIETGLSTGFLISPVIDSAINTVAVSFGKRESVVTVEPFISAAPLTIIEPALPPLTFCKMPSLIKSPFITKFVSAEDAPIVPWL